MSVGITVSFIDKAFYPVILTDIALYRPCFLVGSSCNEFTMRDLAGILCCLGGKERQHVLQIRDFWEGIILTKVCHRSLSRLGMGGGGVIQGQGESYKICLEQ